MDQVQGAQAKERSPVDRLREEQLRDIDTTNLQIRKLEQFREDYKSLQSRLTTLPDRITHDVMVPFGKYAMMPGQLIHTNEVLVLLGDDWFVERSARQAIDIAGRRAAALSEQIKALEGQRNLLEPRLQFTSELDRASKDQQDMVEIKEEYDEEKEASWKEHHRASVRRQKEQERSKQTDTRGPGSTTDRDDSAALWSRLDELERQERRNREMSRDTEPSENSNVKTKKEQAHGVRWKDQEEEEEEWEDEEDEEEEEEDDEEDQEDDDDTIRPMSISFSHSASIEQNPSSTAEGQITSPSDIYRQFVQPSITGPKSILKNTGHTQPQSITQSKVKVKENPHQVEPISTSFPDRPEAFTGTIREKPVAIATESTATPTERETKTEDTPQKKTSRFKAQRTKKE